MERALLLTTAVCLLLAGVHCVPMERRAPRPLSNEPHYTPESEHNAAFDNEAFLGKEEAAEFKDLSPEESRRRLRVICERIDTDKDGYITHDELKKWVEHVSHRYITDNVETRFPHHDKDKDGKISFEEYKETTYGTIEDENAEYDPHRKLTFKQALAREERKFKGADEDKDNLLNIDEFKAFLHPEEYDHMRDIVIDEAFQDMDKNGDQLITLEEYIEDIWPSWDRKEGEAEPEWVAKERDHFHRHRDTDGDKSINRRELSDWIAPDGFEHAEAEAKHLIYNADRDKDKKLTVDEIMQNQELFVGSQATEFGNYLYRHDEF